MGEFPSGQRGQTVNLLAMPSVVRIHLPPPSKKPVREDGVFAWYGYLRRRIRREACQKTCRWHVFPPTRPAPQSGRIHLPPPSKKTRPRGRGFCLVWVFAKGDSKGGVSENVPVARFPADPACSAEQANPPSPTKQKTRPRGRGFCLVFFILQFHVFILQFLPTGFCQ